MRNNPFADTGKIVTGNRFVGRKKAIEEIELIVLGETPGNLSIVGMPRVGKSSLVWNVIIEREQELIEKKILPVYIYCKSHSSDFEILEAIIKNIHQNLISKFPNIDLTPLTKTKVQIEECKTTIEKKGKIKHYLEILKALQFRTICILDDFDHTRTLFSASSFNFLREIASRVSTGLSLITISHRTIFEIEKYVENVVNANTNPYLFNVVSNTMYLGLFNEDDINEYWERFYDDMVSEMETFKVYKTTGYHPFILDMFNYRLWNEIDNGKTVLDAIENVNRVINFSELYRHLITFLKDEDLDTKLLKTINGENIDLKKEDIVKMQNYGLIKKVEGFTFVSFSEDFTNYLRALSFKGTETSQESLIIIPKKGTFNPVNPTKQLTLGEGPESSVRANFILKSFQTMKNHLWLPAVVSLFLLLIFLSWAKPGSELDVFGWFKVKQGPLESSLSDVKIVTVVGSIKINGINATSDDISKIYIKDNTLVSPVSLDDGRFKLQAVPVPADNLVTIAIELDNGATKSALFNLPTPNDHNVSDLQEILLKIKKPENGRRTNNKNNSPILIITNQNIQQNEIDTLESQ